MSNRQQRRHPTHPALPILQQSGRAPVQKSSGKPNSKGFKGKKVKNKDKLG